MLLMMLLKVVWRRGAGGNSTVSVPVIFEQELQTEARIQKDGEREILNGV